VVGSSYISTTYYAILKMNNADIKISTLEHYS
jgi:hypothetical protein